MYLATAFVSQYIPGVDSPDNLRTAQQAIDEYQKVIDANPSRDQKVNSAKGIAYLYLNEKKWDDAKKYYRMASDLDPNDPEPYYSVGRDRLDGLLPAAHGRARQAGHEAGREPESRRTKIRRRFAAN